MRCGRGFIIKNILITGARFFTALDLARLFHLSGYQVFVADSKKIHICFFSNAIKKSFFIPSPRFAFDSFQKKIQQIVEDYNIDLIVPVFEESLYLAKAYQKFSNSCEIFCPNLHILNQLHNKWLFYNLQQKLGIDTIPTRLIKNIDDLKNFDLSTPYVLKPCYSRGSFFLQKVSDKSFLPPLKISSNNPLIAQNWKEGKKYCSYSICRKGNIQANAVYLNEETDEKYCLSFEAVEHKKIFLWIEKFVRSLNFTGQISFDFVEEKGGRIFAIECNPRSTGGLHLLSSNPHICKCFFEQKENVIQPIIGTGRQIALGMVLYGWRQNNKKDFSRFLRKHFRFKDVIFNKKDLKPFLFQLLVYFESIWRSIKYKLSIPEAFIYDLNWEEEIDQ